MIWFIIVGGIVIGIIKVMIEVGQSIEERKKMEEQRRLDEERRREAKAA